jgi:hypothetical protein
MMRQMTEHADSIRLHVDSRMASFTQGAEAPVQQAVQASTTAAGMASDLAGRYAGIQDNLERTFNAATAAHHASEYARIEALQQAQVARYNLEAATAAMNQVRHENASSMTQTEALAAQVAHSQLRERERVFTEEGLPTTSTSQSEFGSRFNPLLGSTVHPHLRFDPRPASPTSTARPPSLEGARVFNPFPNSVPISTPSSIPQIIVIQRPAATG